MISFIIGFCLFPFVFLLSVLVCEHIADVRSKKAFDVWWEENLGKNKD